MNPPDEATDSIAAVINDHLGVCSKLLALAQREAEALKNAPAFPLAEIQTERRSLLAQLESALHLLGQKQALWQKLSSERRARKPQMNQLLQTAMDTIMRILVLDRENEQALLRRGLLPTRALPPVEQSRPHYVARLYQHHGKS